ncbi:MAG: PQQ-binding-like beta-propeller repeat protein [Methanomicrobium sp.]|nr:PQQ-binding-like beta-propeller repeat protein [Methanomicrobium sp.]
MGIKGSYKMYLPALAVLLLLSGICAASAASAAPAAGTGSGPEYEWIEYISTYCDDNSTVSNVTISSIVQMPDGTYIAGGKDDSGRAVFGLDKSGNIVWVKKISGGDAEGSVRFVEKSPDGSVYLFTDGENLIKLENASADAREVWTYHVPLGAISSIEVLDDGNVLMGGDFLQSFLTMVGTDGQEVWNRSLGNPAGGGQFRLRSVQTGNDGKYVVTGYVDPIYYENAYRAFAMEINATGGDVWNQQYQTENVSIFFTSVAAMGDGGYAVGALESPMGEVAEGSEGEADAVYQPYLVILDKDGRAISKKAMNEVDFIYNIQKAADGGLFLLCGKTKGPEEVEHVVVKTDSAGNVDWLKSFDTMRVRSIQPLSDNSLLTLLYDEDTGNSVIIKTEPSKPVKPAQSGAKQSPGFAVTSVFAALAGACGVLALVGRKNE